MICAGCGTVVKWYATATGKRVTLDPSTDPNGNVIIGVDNKVIVLTTGQDAWLRSTPLFPDEFWTTYAHAPRHVVHLAVCTNPKGADPPRDLTAHRRL